MTLKPLTGHENAQATVRAAFRSGRLPQMLLVTGPSRVGKQRFGLWLAQLVLCEETAAAPCGACRSCGQVLGLAHPDLHWFMPVQRPKAGEVGKQVEELAGIQAEVLAERREAPLYPAADGLHGHFVATARLLQRQAALKPAAGGKKVFLIGAADRLVPQESSPDAANALLKLLEEPPADSYFILTAVDASRLLPTIRSRAVQLRLGRLPDVAVREFLRSHLNLNGDSLERRVRDAAGAIGRVIGPDSENGRAATMASELLVAVEHGGGARAERALKQMAWAARGDFTAMLDELAETYAVAARQVAGGAVRRAVPDSLRRTRSLDALTTAGERIRDARDAAQGNINPQLLLATLMDDLAETL